MNSITAGPLNKSALRQTNERLLLNVLRRNPSVSRSDLARITGLSHSSITFIVNRLIKQNVLSEEPFENHSQVGRRPTALRLRSEALLAIGIEVSLSGASLALVDIEGRILREKSVAWQPNPGVFLAKVNSALLQVLKAFDAKQILGVGVGLPGFVDRSNGKVIAAENLNWFGVEVGAYVRRGLDCPLFFDHTAKLSALAEMWFPPPDSKPLRDFVFIRLNGGLGSGVIVNGQMLHGASDAGAEMGHTMLYPGGRKCSCGNSGCWEQYGSDLALIARFEELSGVKATAGEIVQRARRGEEQALQALRDTARHLGMGFVNVIMAMNPEAVIVGDFLASAWDLVRDDLLAVVRARVPAYYLSGVRIYPSAHADNSCRLGAAALVFSDFFSSFLPPNGTPAEASAHTTSLGRRSTRTAKVSAATSTESADI